MKSIILCLLILTIINPGNSQTRNLYVEGSGSQLGVIHSSSTTGNTISGIELLRGNEFKGTDWRVINDGGSLKFVDGIDNFLTTGTENMRLTSSGSLMLYQGSESSIGNNGGVLLVGNSSGLHLSIDQNEILSRNGTNGSDLYLQAGAQVGNTYLNIADGNVGIGSNSAPVKLSIAEGDNIASASGGYLLLGYQSSANLVLDNNEIRARNGNADADLIIQSAEAGKVGIGTHTPNTKLAIRDNSFQLNLSNEDQDASDWYIGASHTGWNVGGDKLVFSTSSASGDAMLILDDTNNTINVRNNRITNVATPVDPNDAVNLEFFNQIFIPADITNESVHMTFAECATHCRDLTHDGYSNWRLPDMRELSYFAGYSVDNTLLWTTETEVVDGTVLRVMASISTGATGTAAFDDNEQCRCVR